MELKEIGEFNDVMTKIQEIFPNASFGQDNDGQAIIYTNAKLYGQETMPTLSAGEELFFEMNDDEQPNKGPNRSTKEPILMHICNTSDGVEVPCMCVRGQDHNEEEFDIPVGDPLPTYDD